MVRDKLGSGGEIEAVLQLIEIMELIVVVAGQRIMEIGLEPWTSIVKAQREAPAGESIGATARGALRIRRVAFRKIDRAIEQESWLRWSLPTAGIGALGERAPAGERERLLSYWC